MVSEKRCPRCETVKPAKEFSRSNKAKSGLSAYCKPCQREYDLSKYDREAVRLQSKRWYSKHPDVKYKKAARRLGVPLEKYMAIASQGYCDICGVECARPHVDHCHKTGKVRGGLCIVCNVFLGALEKRVDSGVLDRYLDYAKRGGFRQ